MIMMEDKIAEFAVINNLESMEEKYLTCVNCQQWLTRPIFALDNGASSCSNCNTSQENTTTSVQRNWALEVILGRMKYPCMHDKCDHVENATSILSHMNICAQKPIVCPYCTEDDLSESTIVAHLVDKHKTSVSNLDIDEPFAELNLNQPVGDKKLFVINVKGNTFVVVCKNASFAIGKQTVDVDFTNNRDTYMIQYCNDEFEARIRGTTVRVQDVLNENMRLIKMHLPAAAAPLLLKLFFNEYEELQRVMRECPICLSKFTNEVYFCENHHGVCTSCAQKVTKCPHCEQPFSKQKVDLKMHLAQVPFPCPNQGPNEAAGCIALVRHYDMDAHLVHCLYSKVTCIGCSKEFARANIAQHIREQYTLVQNFHMFHAVLVDNKLDCIKAYVCYKGQIFYFNMELDAKVEDEKQNLSFYVQLLYDRKKICQQFRYEVYILKADDTLFHRVGNVCQPDDDKSASAMVNWNFCKKVLRKVENDVIITFRLCLYEIPDVK